MEASQQPTRRPLTKRTIDAARYTGSGRNHCILWDGALPGFGLRIQPTGRKSFVFRCRTANGTKRLVTLARYPGATVEQARKLAHRMLAEVLEGQDPAASRRRSREAIRFDALAEAYLERHAKIHKRSWADDEQRIRDYLRPAWGSRKAESIQRRDVAERHGKLSERGIYLANRTLKLVSVIFSWGERMGYLPENHPNPARGVTPFPEQSRDRWLSREEVAGLFAALKQEPDVYVRAFFVLSLLTGARKSELLHLQWSDVDLEVGLLHIRSTKAGRTHHIPLSQPARDLLKLLPREASNLHVFVGAKPGRALVNVSKPWKRLCERAKVEDARLHDLRRTAGSWLAQQGESLLLIGRILNHSTPQATQVYAHIAEKTQRDALEQLGAQIVHAAGLLPAETDPS
ncbi:MAG: site-specific integrase [Deltaproteobacteria bacterium]|nr:site-specific integrase [Deltaproteobacteria bacterium]